MSTDLEVYEDISPVAVLLCLDNLAARFLLAPYAWILLQGLQAVAAGVLGGDVTALTNDRRFASAA